MEDLGILVLHGFSASLDTVSGLAPRLEQAGLKYAMPTLRGHGSSPEQLLGVTWRDWLEDARESLLELTADGRRGVVIGLSMGGLLALVLAAEHRPRVAGVASLAACLRFRSPLVSTVGLLRRVITWWPAQPDYEDPEQARSDTNYTRFPVEGVASLQDLARVADALLPTVRAPLCVLASTNDPVVPQSAARRILARSGSPHREVHWFHRSRHEMLRDVERDSVSDALMQFIARVRAGELEVAEPVGAGGCA